MSSIKRSIQVLALGVCATAFAPSALAEAQRGFYLGLSAGQSTYDLEQDDFDDVITDVMRDFGFPVLSRSSTFEDSDTSIGIIAGYRFLPYIAVEGSYLDHGAAEYRFSGTIRRPVQNITEAITFGADIETKGFTIGALGSLPLGQVMDFHGRLGLFIAETELKFTSAGAFESGRETESLDSEGIFIGVGLGFHLGEHWSLSLDWARYNDVGDENDYDDFEDDYDDEDYEDYDDSDGGFDIDRFSLSATFRFK